MPQHEQAEYYECPLMLELGLLMVASVVYQDVVQPRQQHEPSCHVYYVLAHLIEMPVDACGHQQSDRETGLQYPGQGEQ